MLKIILFGNYYCHLFENSDGIGFVKMVCPLCGIHEIWLHFEKDEVFDCQDKPINPYILSICEHCIWYLNEHPQSPLWDRWLQLLGGVPHEELSWWDKLKLKCGDLKSIFNEWLNRFYNWINPDCANLVIDQNGCKCGEYDRHCPSWRLFCSKLEKT